MPHLGRMAFGAKQLALALLAGACGSSALEITVPAPSSPMDASADVASADSPAAPPPMDAAPACTDLALEGPPVVYEYEYVDASEPEENSQVPVPTGGTIVDGTYLLESAILYRGEPPGVRREIMRVIGDRLEMVTETEDATGVSVQRGRHTFTTTNGRLIPTPECADPPLQGIPGAGTYEATPTSIAIQFQNRRRAIRWQYKRKR